MPLPPWDEVWLAVRTVIGPSLGAAAGVYLLVRLLLGMRRAPLAAALAVGAGGLAGTWAGEAMPLRLDPEQPLMASAWLTAAGQSLGVWRPAVDPAPPLPPPRYWLPWLALAAVVVETLVRWPRWPWFGAWGLRGLVVAAAAVLLTPAEQRAEEPWLLPAVGGVMLLAWAIGRQTARSWPKGWPALLAACMAALGAGVMLHAHSARLTDLLLVGFGTLAGIGLSARFLPGDQGPALAAAALWLPGLALTAHHETFSDVPTWGLALVGLAPLGLAALLPAGFLQRWGRVVFGLACLAALAPVGAALFLAVRAVTLEF